MFKFFDPISECLIAMEEVQKYGKIVTYASKTFLNMVGGRMHTPHPTLLAISYRNHLKSLAYFSHLAPLILFFFTKRQSQKGRGEHGTMPLHPKYALVSTFRSIKVLMVDFQKKGLDKTKVFVDRDEAPYFSEALGFNLPSLLVNPALPMTKASYNSF